MATSLFKSSAARSALRAASSASSRRAGVAGVTFVRGKATLPDLPCKLTLGVQMKTFHFLVQKY